MTPEAQHAPMTTVGRCACGDPACDRALTAVEMMAEKERVMRKATGTKSRKTTASDHRAKVNALAKRRARAKAAKRARSRS